MKTLIVAFLVAALVEYIGYNLLGREIGIVSLAAWIAVAVHILKDD